MAIRPPQECPTRWIRSKASDSGNLLDIVNEGGDSHAGTIDLWRRSAAEALIVEDQFVRVGKWIQMGEQVTVLQHWPTMNDDDWFAAADPLHIEFCAVNRE